MQCVGLRGNLFGFDCKLRLLNVYNIVPMVANHCAMEQRTLKMYTIV